MRQIYLKFLMFMVAIAGFNACAGVQNSSASESRDIKSYSTQNINVNKKKPSLIEPAAGTPKILDGVAEPTMSDLIIIPEEPFSKEAQATSESITEDILLINPDNSEEDASDISRIMSDISVESGFEKSLAQAYFLGADDKIKITVFGEQDLSGEFVVNNDGMITFPLIGAVNVNGKTTTEVEATLKDHLSGDYLKDPSVVIEIIKNRPFYILGEVRMPGSYDFVNGINILQAVALSGGFTYRANRKSIDVMRGLETPAEPAAMNPQDPVKPGDIIYVRERFF